MYKRQVYSGIDKGIEKFSKVLMPILLLLVVGISVFSLTLSHTDENGVTRTGLEGLKIYLVPDFSGMTAGRFLVILMDAMGQLFFSISVAMGIMVAYGSYAKKETNLIKSINQIAVSYTHLPPRKRISRPRRSRTRSITRTTRCSRTPRCL